MDFMRLTITWTRTISSRIFVLNIAKHGISFVWTYFVIKLAFSELANIPITWKLFFFSKIKIHPGLQIFPLNGESISPPKGPPLGREWICKPGLTNLNYIIFTIISVSCFDPNIILGIAAKSWPSWWIYANNGFLWLFAFWVFYIFKR